MAIILKLREKLHALLLIRYRYFVITTKKEFLKLNIKGYEIKNTNEYISFYANKLEKNILSNSSLIITDRYNLFFKTLFKTRLITSLSVLFILLIFLTSTLFIREIEFSDDATYNYSVLKDVESYIKKFGPFYYLNDNLNELSCSLRVKYHHYAYIGVRKKGAKIFIDIEKANEYPQVDEVLDKPCDLVANVDGLVVGYEVKKGISVVNINDIISKGDVLISGNLNYHLGITDKNNLVHALGYVLIEYAAYEKIIVPKIISYNDLTKMNEKYLEVCFFNKRIGNSRVNFNDYFLLEDNIIQINNVFSINRIIKYEVIKKTKNINISDAKELALENIYTTFYLNKVSEKEQIKMVKFIQVEENNDEYIFHFLVKYIKNETIIKYY